MAFLKTLMVILVSIAGLYGGTFWLVRNPQLPRANQPAPQKAEPARLSADVRLLSTLKPPRNGRNVDGLNAAAAHIAGAFAASDCDVTIQTFRLHQVDYQNVICSFGPRAGTQAGPRLVIGAHYDVLGDENPGADDNASGLAGLMELARMIKATAPELAYRLDIVAFALEEPPYFQTEAMGSYAYAKSLFDQGVEVKLMISVEMIGYFSDQPESQTYPLGLLELYYPTRANFIGVVGLTFERAIVAEVKALIETLPNLPAYSINAPSIVTGVDFSDHWSFWQFDYPAIMVTDTAFLRNPNYHRSTDRPDTLDYQRMAQTVDGLYRVAVEFGN